MISKEISVLAIALLATMMIVVPYYNGLAFAAKSDSAGDSGGGNKGSSSSSDSKGDSGGTSGSMSDGGNTGKDTGGGGGAGIATGGTSGGPSGDATTESGGTSGSGGAVIGGSGGDQFPNDGERPHPTHCITPSCDGNGGDMKGEHGDFCKAHPNICTDRSPHFHDHDHNHDVKVIHKTVVVHDRNNTPQNIIVSANANGQCIITQSQVLSGNNVLSELLDQCVSVTIVRG